MEAICRIVWMVAALGTTPAYPQIFILSGISWMFKLKAIVRLVERTLVDGVGWLTNGSPNVVCSAEDFYELDFGRRLQCTTNSWERFRAQLGVCIYGGLTRAWQ